MKQGKPERAMSALAVALAAVLAAALSWSPGAARAQAGTDMSTAEVRKVDKDAKKITLRHGEIKNLDMPPMTMVFQMGNAALPEGLKAGDRVRFTAEKVQGQYTVTRIEMEPR